VHFRFAEDENHYHVSVPSCLTQNLHFSSIQPPLPAKYFSELLQSPAWDGYSVSSILTLVFLHWSQEIGPYTPDGLCPLSADFQPPRFRIMLQLHQPRKPDAGHNWFSYIAATATVEAMHADSNSTPAQNQAVNDISQMSTKRQRVASFSVGSDVTLQGKLSGHADCL